MEIKKGPSFWLNEFGPELQNMKYEDKIILYQIFLQFLQRSLVFQNRIHHMGCPKHPDRFQDQNGLSLFQSQFDPLIVVHRMLIVHNSHGSHARTEQHIQS